MGPPPPPPDQSPAGRWDESNYQKQPQQGRFGGRSFGLGGRARGGSRFDDRGRGRGGRARGGRFDDRGRSFQEGRGLPEGRGFQEERGFQEARGFPEARGSRGRGFFRGGRFANTTAAPIPGRGGSRGSGRHYEGRGRGRGRFRGRGRDQWASTPVTDFSPAGRGEPSAGRGEPDRIGRESDWNTRSPDVGSDTTGPMPPEWSSGGDLEWGNPVEALEPDGNRGGRDAEWSNQSSATRGQFDSESRGGSSDWAGRDREWHSSSPAMGGQLIPGGRRGGGAGGVMLVQSLRDWSNRVGTLNEGRGAPNESPGMAPRHMMSPPPPDSERASSGPIPFADEGDYTMKRKRGESPMNMGGPPFDDRRQPSWEGSEMYTSPAGRQFHNHNPPPQGPIGDGPPYGQHFPGSPREWMGGRGRGRGSMQGKRRGGRGDFGGRSDFGGRGDYHAGRGLPPPAFHDGPPPPQFQDGPSFPDAPPLPPVGGSPMVDRDTAGSMGHYGPQANDFSRTATPGRPPLPPGEGPSGGGFNRYHGRDGGSFHPPPLPPPQHHGPPPPHGMPPRRESDSSVPWNRPTLRESVSTGSYASLAESGPPSAPFMDDSTRGEPRVRLPSPPISDMRIPTCDSQEPDLVQTKPSTPTPAEEEVVVEAPKSPPSPVGPPSGLMVALTRLADLESQLDFALAKHTQLARQRELLEVQTEHLKTLPVGVDAFQEELAKIIEENK